MFRYQKKSGYQNVRDDKSVPVLWHTEIPPELQAPIRSTYDAVGKYHTSTFEQWEVGFMENVHIFNEVHIWQQIAKAFAIFHEKAALPTRAPDVERRLVDQLAIVTTGNRPEGIEPQELETLKECLREAGWTVSQPIIILRGPTPKRRQRRRR